MACSGPRKDFAIIKSQVACEEILQLLKDRYQVERPEMGIGFEKKMQGDWDKEEAMLRKAVADLFWTSDAASF